MPAIYVSPTAVANELHALIDGLLNGGSAGVAGRVKYCIHSGIAVIQKAIVKPSAHGYRRGGVRAGFSVVSGCYQSAFHPAGIAHKRFGFIADGLGGHHGKFHDIREGKTPHQEVWKVVTIVHQGVKLIVCVVFLILG